MPSIRPALILLLAILGARDACAQPALPGETPAFPAGQNIAPPITSAFDRAVLTLSGTWRAIPDPYESGTMTHLSQPRGDGWWLDRQRAAPEQRIEYAFNSARPIDVPGDWNSQHDDLFFYEGHLWYRTTFAHEPGDEKRQFLVFGAVNRHADVWLNGDHLGSHHVGFTPFAFEVTGRIEPGENSLVVRVDNRRRPEDVPAMRTDWWNYGGITRDVALLEVPETFVRAWEAGLTPDGTDIRVTVTLDGADAQDRAVRVRLPELGLDTTATTNIDGVAEVRWPWPDRARRWSPEDPALYTIQIDAGEQTQAADRVGFRTIATRGREILLNDRPVFLRGICIHEEAPGGSGRAWSEAHARTLLGWAKDLGCNYVRLAHYTHNEHMLRVADELGLMVWAEIPVYWVLDFENDTTRTYARTHLTEMIERDRNRASVVIWSVGNENEANDTQTALRAELAELARALDPTRLISAACFVRMTRGDDGRLASLIVDDPFGEHADVLAVNQYIGWYHDHTRQLEGMDVRTGWEKPLVFSEFGAGVKQGLRADAETVWTEEFGARFYQDQFAWCDDLRRAGKLQGTSPWILTDFRSPRRPLGEVQDWYNRKGLISEHGLRKDNFYVVQDWYRRWAGE